MPIRTTRFLAVLVCSLAAGTVFILGFLHAFAAFSFLPIALALCIGVLFRQRVESRWLWWLRLLAGNALILLFLVSLLFFGAETYYRFFCDRTDAMGNTLVSIDWTRRHVQTNASGFRDDVEYPNKMVPGRRRVTFVGDSFTYGFGVKNVEDRFVNRIRRLHPEWEVHAVAKPGLDTSTEVEIVHNLAVTNGYELDLVVLVYQINDIGEVMPGWVVAYKEMMADRFRSNWLFQNSYLINLFYHRWQLHRSSYLNNYFDEVEAAYKGPLWEVEKVGLLAFSNMTRVRGGRLVVVTFPYMDAASRFKFAHEQLDEYWRRRGIPHLDLLPTFAGIPPHKLVANRHDAHPNEYAHALAARTIDEFLQREISARVGTDR